jgi:serine/threonine protein phosphatase PrpC
MTERGKIARMVQKVSGQNRSGEDSGASLAGRSNQLPHATSNPDEITQSGDGVTFVAETLPALTGQFADQSPGVVAMYVPLSLETERDREALGQLLDVALDAVRNGGYTAVTFSQFDKCYPGEVAWQALLTKSLGDYWSRFPGHPLDVSVDDGASVQTVSVPQAAPGGVTGLETPGADHGPDEPIEERGGEEPVNEAGAAAAPDEVPPQVWVQGKHDHRIQTLDGRYVLGEPRGTFMQIPFLAKQPAKTQFRSDIAADIVRADRLQILAASLRGASHHGSQTVRQDSYALGTVGEGETARVIAVVADGVAEATRSHQMADSLSQQTVLYLQKTLSSDPQVALGHADWSKSATDLKMLSRVFCERSAQGKVPPEQWLSYWATTLEFAVVEADGPRVGEFVCVTVAGDGAAYVVDTVKGWKTLKAGKLRSGEVASNAVTALPADPGAPVVSRGTLEPGQALLLATDGLADMVGNGGNDLGGFLQYQLPRCPSVASYIRIMDVCMFQADDDRTAITIQVARP